MKNQKVIEFVEALGLEPMMTVSVMIEPRSITAVCVADSEHAGTYRTEEGLVLENKVMAIDFTEELETRQ